MPNYEHVFICRQDLTSVEAETLAEEFKGTLTENGGKVVGSEYWGLRSIAYRMNKNRKGHYFMFKLESDPKAWVSGEPGTDNAAMEYLMTFNPMAVGADTWGIDNVPPSKGDKVFYGHVTALQNNGVYLLETMNTGKLVKEGVKEFMFVLGQARVEGTVQMIINPVAIY